MNAAPFKARKVSFRHGDAQLAGTLFLPTLGAACPALVMLQGSGATDRTNFGYFPQLAEYFARHGIAVLCYDKPGVGSSTGDWREQTMSDRAKEALAALRFLRAQAGVDAGKVGLWGISQGGWVAPLAASMSQDVAFVVSVSGPGVTPLEQDRYGLEHLARAAGHTETQIQEALELYDAFAGTVRSSKPFSHVRDLVKHGNDAWKAYFNELDEASWRFFARIDPHTGQPNSRYEPVLALEKLTCPILVIFGADDPLVPVEKSVAIIRAALRHNARATTKVFPASDHGVRCWADKALVPGYLERMRDWVHHVN